MNKRFSESLLQQAASVLALALSACSANMHPTTTPASRDAFGRLHFALRAALSRGDSSALIGLFDANSTTRLQDGRSLRGQGAAADALLGSRFGTGLVAVNLETAEPDFCSAGGVAYATYSIVRRDGDVTRDVEHGAYGLEFAVDGERAKVVRLVLAPTVTEARRDLPVCESLRGTRLAQRRFEVSVVPVVVGPSWQVSDDLESELAAAGWTRAAAEGPTEDGFGTGHTRQDTSPIMAASASVRLLRAARLELSTQIRSQSGTLTTYNTSNSSMLTQHFTARPLNVATTWEWHSLRAGGGVSMVVADWTESYARVLRDTTKKPFVYLQDFTAARKSAWKSHALGGFFTAEYVVPVSTNTFLTAAATTRFAGSTSAPGVPTHDRWAAHWNGSTGQLGIGVAW